MGESGCLRVIVCNSNSCLVFNIVSNSEMKMIKLIINQVDMNWIGGKLTPEPKTDPPIFHWKKTGLFPADFPSKQTH